MQEKLVEEWLTKAGERGGIDQAFGQWLVSQGHEILWLGHSRTEFGKDIVTVDQAGNFHAFQIKDEDLSLAELRKHDAQINELIDIPIVHARVPSGSLHTPHLVTSGIAKEEAMLKIRAKNEGLRAKGLPELNLVDRGSLVPRFVEMADNFWPDKPKNIRDFFSFYLAEGRGDFDAKRFASLLFELLPTGEIAGKNIRRCPTALCIIGNYMLSSFERENDHWSLFRGWCIIASYVLWHAKKTGLAEQHWRGAFLLAKDSSIDRLRQLARESFADNALAPKNFEFDDYTRSRNTVIAGVLAAFCLLKEAATSEEKAESLRILNLLITNGRLIVLGEQALPMIFLVLWISEAHMPSLEIIKLLMQYVITACERNGHASDDEPIPPPHTDIDEILAHLFSSKPPPEKRKKGKSLWGIEALVHILARRGERDFLSQNWQSITKLDLITFNANDVDDLLLWHEASGREEQRKPRKTESWNRLVQESHQPLEDRLPSHFSFDIDFALIYFLAYPHRISTSLVGHLDLIYRTYEAYQHEQPRLINSKMAE